jgi:hypothetical protein
MGQLVNLHTQDEQQQFPRPLCYRKGEKYAYLPLSDYPGFGSEAFCLVWLGKMMLGEPHVFETGEGVIMGGLIKTTESHYVIESQHPEFPSGTYSKRKLELLGWVTDFYTVGPHGPHYVSWSAVMMAEDLDYSRPVLALHAKG